MPIIFDNDHLSVTSPSQTLSLSSLTKGRDEPFYVYDGDEMIRRARKFQSYSLVHPHYAMKANSNAQLLREFARLGLGVDVVSSGEFHKALSCGFPPEKVIYSGVAKSVKDLKVAIELGLLQINVESLEELQRLKTLSDGKSGPTVRVALRMNLAVDVPTHPYIQTSSAKSKFGLPVSQLPSALEILKSSSGLQLQGLSVHVGSQIKDLEVFKETTKTMLRLSSEVQSLGFALKTLDLGGGLGIDYQSDADDTDFIEGYFQTLKNELAGSSLKILLEPGRCLVGKSGALVARVEYVKQTPQVDFVLLNSGIHHLMRPALYGAFHRIVPLTHHQERQERVYDVAGPLCESSDFFAKERRLPELRAGEWVGILDAGAYGHVMASTYNESPWPAELFVWNGKIHESQKLTQTEERECL